MKDKNIDYFHLHTLRVVVSTMHISGLPTEMLVEILKHLLSDNDGGEGSSNQGSSSGLEYILNIRNTLYQVGGVFRSVALYDFSYAVSQIFPSFRHFSPNLKKFLTEKRYHTDPEISKNISSIIQGLKPSLKKSELVSIYNKIRNIGCESLCDLELVKGTGKGNRLLKKDILNEMYLCGAPRRAPLTLEQAHSLSQIKNYIDDCESLTRSDGS